MTENTPTTDPWSVAPPRRASLELLRAEASDELAVIIQHRLRAGEDPWAFMEDLPTVDEMVVLTLRADMIEAAGGTRPDLSGHRRMMATIASAHPGLAPTAQHLLHAVNGIRRWDVAAADDAA